MYDCFIHSDWDVVWQTNDELERSSDTQMQGPEGVCLWSTACLLYTAFITLFFSLDLELDKNKYKLMRHVHGDLLWHLIAVGDTAVNLLKGPEWPVDCTFWAIIGLHPDKALGHNKYNSYIAVLLFLSFP